MNYDHYTIDDDSLLYREFDSDIDSGELSGEVFEAIRYVYHTYTVR